MGKLFGTDGVRGIANDTLTIELATKIGKAAAYILGKDKKIKVLIGMDTRISGTMLKNALIAGLLSQGADIIDIGIVPTPAVSYLINKLNCDMGVMITASHNPAEHNGIKLFNNEGYKLPDKVEEDIEEYILNKEVPSSNIIGKYNSNEDAKKLYVDFLKNSIKITNNKLKIVVDCANGASSETAPALFEQLNIKTEIINNEYNGTNINDNCGSTHMESLITKVKEIKADLGIAYDGDADRCLLVDETGTIVDGDQIMAIIGNYYKEKNQLKNNTIVGTIMSNLGLKKFCESKDIQFLMTKVGDRYVLEEMLKNNYIIGGEQSGHIILKHIANTGDGELTSLEILQIMNDTKKTLSELKQIMKVYPQVLVNVNVTKEGKDLYASNEEIIEIINTIEKEMQGNGRVVIRPSGTENKIRVMLEGENIEEITQKANTLANTIKRFYGI